MPSLLEHDSIRPSFPAWATPACVGATLFAALLDACVGPPLPRVPGALWLDAAALLALACAVLRPGALRCAAAWETPLGGILLATLVLAATQVAGRGGTAGAWRYLGHVAACGGVYVGLVALLRRDERQLEHFWHALALLATLLGAHALWAATLGPGTLQAQDALADARWFGRHTLAKTLVFATLATAGRAAERGGSGPWRLALLVGLAGLAVHAAGGGFGLDASALARLDDPIYFSTACVTVIATMVVAHRAWAVAAARRAEVVRWRFLALATAGMGVSGVLGGGTGGEGVRVVVVVGAAAAVAAALLPKRAATRGGRTDASEEALARAA